MRYSKTLSNIPTPLANLRFQRQIRTTEYRLPEIVQAVIDMWHLIPFSICLVRGAVPVVSVDDRHSETIETVQLVVH